MKKYIKIYNDGFNEGVYDSYRDFINNKIIDFKEIDDKEFMSKLYDLGYIYGYKRFCDILKMHLLIKNKL